MIRYLAFSGCLALTLFCISPKNVVAHEGDRVFHKCSHRLEELTRNCVNNTREIVERCVPEIRALLHEGRVEEARALAHRCINRIEENTRRCNNAIQELCERCIHRLIELERPELAERFRNRCRKARRIIHHAAQTGIETIRNLFD